MKHEDEVLYAALSRIENGDEPKDIADALSVSYATVLRWKREYVEAKESGQVSQLYNVDRLILAKAAEQIDAPLELRESSVERIKTGLSGLDMLDSNLQNTALYMLGRIKSLAASAQHTSEIVELTGAICDLRNAFFNKNSTQVNVQNNYSSGDGSGKYSTFLGDTPNEN